MLAVVVGLVVAAAPASASTLTGRVSGAKLPKAGKGFTTVRAVNATSLLIVDVAKVRSHRYRLKVPAGSYWLFAATTPLRGKAGIDRPGAGSRSAKASARPCPSRCASASAGVRSFRPYRGCRPRAPRSRPVKHPAVWVRHFTVPDGAEYRAMSRGIANMLITELGGPARRRMRRRPRRARAARLPARRAAHRQSGEAAVDGQDDRPQSRSGWQPHRCRRHGDPHGEREERHHRHDPLVTRSAATDRFFELVSSVVPEVVRLICGGKPPGHYSWLGVGLDLREGRARVRHLLVERHCAPEVHGPPRARECRRAAR